MLIRKIQSDLLRYTGNDPDDFSGMAEFWYLANSELLSAALSSHEGLNLIINVKSFENFETLCRRLFLLADTLILRDTRNWDSDFTETRVIPIPISGYRPGFMDEIEDETTQLRASPFTRLYNPRPYWTSDRKILKDGTEIAYAVAGGYHSLPSKLLNWISGPGKHYMETGQIICAPFIPSLEEELELLKQNINLPETFGAQSLFHQSNDFLEEKHLSALLSIDLPFLEGIDVSTISEVKKDYYDEFKIFSSNILDALNKIRSNYGSEDFVKEIRNIQKNQIDASLSDINRTFNRIKKSRALREKGMILYVAGLSAAALFGAPPTTLSTGASASMGALIADRAMKLKEDGEIREKRGYFLWKLREVSEHRSK